MLCPCSYGTDSVATSTISVPDLLLASMRNSCYFAES